MPKKTVNKSKGQSSLAALTGYPPEDRDKYVDFRGWRLRAPWRCMCCGRLVSLRQFCFGRSCAYCDTGACAKDRMARWIPSKKRRKPAVPVHERGCYSGPRELIDQKAKHFIAEDAWSNPPEGLATHPDDKAFPKQEEMMRRFVAQMDKEREQRKAADDEASNPAVKNQER